MARGRGQALETAQTPLPGTRHCTGSQAGGSAQTMIKEALRAACFGVDHTALKKDSSTSGLGARRQEGRRRGRKKKEGWWSQEERMEGGLARDGACRE